MSRVVLFRLDDVPVFAALAARLDVPADLRAAPHYAYRKTDSAMGDFFYAIP